MFPMRNERAKKGRERVVQPGSLRDYWTQPTAARRSVTSKPTSNLLEHQHPLPLSAQKPHALRDGVTQPALPFTWYAADKDHIHQGEDIPSLQHLQKHVEERGVQYLSNTELLTLVLRTEAGREDVVKRIHSLLTSYSVQQLLSIEFGELSKQYELGTAKAAQMQGLLELARRLTMPSQEQKYTIKSPYDAAMLLMPEMAHLDHEEMRVLVLDTKNRVVANILMYQGTVNSSLVRTGEIFRPAVTRKCPAIVVAHNHPSGEPEPSQEDIEVTKQLAVAGQVLEVELLDHLIIGHNNRFTSLKEKRVW